MDLSGLYQIDHKKKKNKTLVFFKKYIVPVIIVSIIAFVVQFSIRKLLVFPVKIAINSMEPAINLNETKFFTYPHLGKIEKNDVVFATRDKIDFFCRIVGVEGEAVQILDKSLFVNHVEVKNYSETSRDKISFKESVTNRDNTPEFLVGPQMFFCLNDNWENIQDSRSWGPIDFKIIRGKVLFK